MIFSSYTTYILGGLQKVPVVLIILLEVTQYVTLKFISLLLQQVIITDDDIRRQEMKVQEARKKLESIMSRR